MTWALILTLAGPFLLGLTLIGIGISRIYRQHRDGYVPTYRRQW